MEKLRSLYDAILGYDNLSVMSYNAREFNIDDNACFVWDGDHGMWLGCAEPFLISVGGGVTEWEETIDGTCVRNMLRWGHAVVGWYDIWTGALSVEPFEGPMAAAFQYEISKMRR
jgi:hypothetical protein